MKVVSNGKPKFVKKIKEVTFNAQEALRKNKIVYYITHIAAFRLTKEGV